MTPTPFFYTVRLDESSRNIGYVHAVISIHNENQYSNSGELYNVRWQAGLNDENPEYYGASINIDTAKLDTLRTATGIANRLEKAGYNLDQYRNQPADLLAALKALKIPYKVYDPRTSEYQTLDELYPAEYDSWRDVNNSSEYCTFDVLARNEEEARSLIAKRFVDEYTTADKLKKWSDDGMQVKLCYRCSWSERLPDYREPAEIIRHPRATTNEEG